jgi:hypothetical protein
MMDALEYEIPRFFPKVEVASSSLVTRSIPRYLPWAARG